ncbi:MAG: type II secretion system F family protein [Planctomycetota bacterium]
MAVFAYEATDTESARVTGTLIADTPRDARDRLREWGLSVHALSDRSMPGRGQVSTGFIPWLGRVCRSRAGGLSARRHGAAALFLRELATLLQVGVPMLEALDTVIRQTPKRQRATWLLLRDRVAAGGSLAEAAREAKRYNQPAFDPISTAMIEVGEDAGRLAEVLEETAAFRERAGELKNRLASALIYPAVVSFVGIAVCLFLMTYVVPGLLESLVDSGRPLPWITRAVRAMSQGLIAWGPFLSVAALVFFVVFALIVRTPRGRYVWHTLLLNLPGVGGVLKKQAVVRLSFVLSTLLRSGVPFERAVGIAKGVTNNAVLQNALTQCERDVHAGRDLGPALEATKAFPPTVVQVFALGQASGTLENLLDRLARSYDRQVATLTDRLTALIEPVLIVLLAVAVGAIAFATVLPILEISNSF